MKDEYGTSDVFSASHWVYNGKSLFKREDGLAILTGIGPVDLSPMTIGQPHSHTPGTEEVWFAMEGDVTLLLGKQLRDLPPGTAYMVPPDGITAHSNINPSLEPAKLMWLMKTPR